MVLSQKQINSYQQSDARMNIWVGAVRSGKTYSSLRKLLNLIRTGPPGDCMIIGVSRDSIQRNVLNELYKFLGEDPPTPKRTQEKLYGRNIYFVGATDVSAVRRIQGATLALAYVDEIACVPQVFIKMLQSRLSVTGAQLLATCNPEGPAHWLKKEYIDKQENLNLKVFNFTLDDNPSLSDDYKSDLKREYSGAWYKRLILGEWAVAQGLVYDAIDDDNFFDDDNYQNPNFYIAGIDYGINNPTVCLLAACNPNSWPQIRIVDEYYFDSKKHPRPKTDAELADDLEKFLLGRNLNSVYIDPSAASFKLELERRNFPVIDACNDVIPGIQTVNKFLLGKNLLISNKCTHLKDELFTYSWDERAADKGEDKPVKVSDHCCFVADTMVSTDKGDVPIQFIKKGDKVLTRNGYQKVLGTMISEVLPQEVIKCTIGEKELIGTKNHPIYVDGKWIPLNSVGIGIKTCILSNDKHLMNEAIVSVNVCSYGNSEGKIKVYNLKVENHPEYFANGILSHNCDSLRYLCHTEFPDGDFENYSGNMSYASIIKQILPEQSMLQDFSNMDYY